MSRRVITTLIIFMALVMTSLILVQTNSIIKALQIKEEQFDAAVNSALSRVIDRLEKEETAELSEITKAYSSQRNIGVYPGTLQGSLAGTLSQQRSQLSVQFLQKSSGSIYTEELTINYGNPVQKGKNERGRPGDFPNAFDVHQALDGYISQQYEDRQNKKAEMLAQTQLQMALSNLPIERRIDVRTLGRSIKTELKKQGINLEFRYAVKSFSKGKERLVYGDKNFNPKQQNDYSTLLFPSDLEDLKKPDWLYIYFPTQNSYLLKETGILITPTIVLTAMLIGIFVYTIMVILKQKKLSDIKNDFINNMTHELKTPISTISLASQMLRDNTVNNTPKTVDHISGIIYQESKRLTTQVEKVLQMAVFNEGSLKLKFKEVNI